ncbi:tRNA 2-selenouridine(34) synthase MnmH [Amphiplicatus metriothermophilus]
MIETVPDVEPARLARFDAIIDARSPGEYAEDHIPGAINLPALDDAERAAIGTIYVRRSKFEARRRGAALVARNIARHIETALADKPRQWRPLIYCWRGGQRSAAMATVLAQVGWRVGVLQGGYKTWRRAVVETLRLSEAPIGVLLLDGQTGAAKSRILERLAALDVQTLDLEALAAHRGSVFGGWADRPQPGQKMFESLLFQNIRRLDPARPIVVEAESNHIGRCVIPRRLWRAMRAAPRIEVKADAALRARHIAAAYDDLIRDREAVLAALARLAPFHDKARIERWRTMAQAEDYAALAAELMRDHYDPLYERARKRREDKPLAEIRLDRLDAEDIDAAARRIKDIAERFAGAARAAHSA